jgi:hypothetical protein
MGMNVIPLKELTPDEPKVLTLDLLKNMDPNDVQNEKSRGQIVVELVYKPFKDDEIPKDIDDPNAVAKAPEGTPAGGGLFVVIVHEAQDVEGKHHTNPYARLLFKGEEKRTKVCHKRRHDNSHKHNLSCFSPFNGEDSNSVCILYFSHIAIKSLRFSIMILIQFHYFKINNLYLKSIQQVKKSRDPRWEEEFQFVLEEAPTNERLHVEVVSSSSRMGLLHPKVQKLHLFNCLDTITGMPDPAILRPVCCFTFRR